MNKPQLFLLHFAGGNSYSYQFLKELLPDFEFLPLELPGRGRRIKEPLLHNFQEAADDLLQQISLLQKPGRFVLYGHSMGAVLALKVAWMLEARYRGPAHLIVTGNPGPGVRNNKKRYELEGEALKAELRVIGGMPEEVLENQELFDFFAPVLRADFEVLEKDEELAFHTVKTPIHAIMGSREEAVEDIGSWQRYTSGGTTETVLEGNHFFIYDHAVRLADIIRKSYTASLHQLCTQ